MNLFDSQKKTKLRIKIIMLTVITCMTSLIICGATIFYTYVSSSSARIESDVTFFLDTKTNTFSNKVTLVEDILLRVRNNNTIMLYLDSLNSKISNTKVTTAIQSQFKKCVDIYSDKNTQGLSSPFVKNVYLFPKSTDFSTSICKSMYYSYLQEEESALDNEFLNINKQFNNSTRDIAFYKTASSLRLAASLYDKNFNSIGTLIYDINIDAMNEIMNRSNNYKDSFWFVFDKNHTVLANNNELTLSFNDKKSIMNNHSAYVSNYKADSSTYLVRTEHLGMGFGVVAGIPKNYINVMLYSSIKVYLYMLLILAPIIFLFTFVTIYRLTTPFKVVEEKIKLVTQGEFNTKLPDFKSTEFSNISNVFNDMTDRIHYLINDVYEKKIIIKESELQFLQTQMNPHFTFNVLNTIALQAKLDGNEQVYQMIHSFSLLTQAKIIKNGNEKIKVREEMEYVSFYLYLQKCRFENKLTYDIHMENDLLGDLYIPKLSIQPIVENSMIHGIEPNYTGGHIQINIYSDTTTLYIDVIDNGIGFPQEINHITPLDIKDYSDGNHNHIGTLNIHKIIQHFYGDTYGVYISSKKNQGTSVSLTIPIGNCETIQIGKGEDNV